jgi:hypothetical protein
MFRIKSMLCPHSGGFKQGCELLGSYFRVSCHTKNFTNLIYLKRTEEMAEVATDLNGDVLEETEDLEPLESDDSGKEVTNIPVMSVPPFAQWT